MRGSAGLCRDPVAIQRNDVGLALIGAKMFGGLDKLFEGHAVEPN
jgi:hypothetical protein